MPKLRCYICDRVLGEKKDRHLCGPSFDLARGFQSNQMRIRILEERLDELTKLLKFEQLHCEAVDD